MSVALGVGNQRKRSARLNQEATDTMKNTQIKKLSRDERGLSTMEYAVLFVIIVVGALALWTKLGKSLADQVSQGDQTFTTKLGAGNAKGAQEVQ
jgi:Flp pilus assembly pilin Flp